MEREAVMDHETYPAALEAMKQALVQGPTHGMGKAIVTAILHVAYPSRYGVWNATSEVGLKHIGQWPHFDRGVSLGQKYVAVNELLVRLARDLDIDLWTLDTLLWVPMPEMGRPAPVRSSISAAAIDVDDAQLYVEEGAAEVVIEAQRFALEAHLQRFLWTNWDQTELGREWARYTEPGDPQRGYEYPCGVGRIDILAKHRTEPRWLVVELKRGQSGDDTVGQVLRYMGWIQNELAEGGERVEGLVIAQDVDDKLRYALQMMPSVGLKLYKVDFQLLDASPIRRPG